MTLIVLKSSKTVNQSVDRILWVDNHKNGEFKGTVEMVSSQSVPRNIVY